MVGEQSSVVDTDKALDQFLDGRNRGPWKFEENQPGIAAARAYIALNTNPTELFPSIINLIT